MGQDTNELAEEVAFAIYRYTCERREHSIIDHTEISKFVESLLSLLGFEEMACVYALKNRCLKLQFDEIMVQASPIFELVLYRQLDRLLENVMERDIASLHLAGLRTCVMRVCGVRRWSRGCQTLSYEILEHVRARMGQLCSEKIPMMEIKITH